MDVQELSVPSRLSEPCEDLMSCSVAGQHFSGSPYSISLYVNLPVTLYLALNSLKSHFSPQFDTGSASVAVRLLP